MDADAGAAADSAIAATTATSLTPEAYFLPMDDARRPAYLLRMRGRAVLPAILFGVLGMVVAGVAVGFAVGHYSLRVTTVTIASAPAAGPTPSSATASVDPTIAAGAHTFVQFACVQCHGDRGRGGISPDVPALTTVGKRAHRRAALAHHRPRPRRVEESDEAVHARLGRGHLEDTGRRSRRVHPRWASRGAGHAAGRRSRRARARRSQARRSTSATAASTATGRTASAASPIRSRRTRAFRRFRAAASATTSRPTRRSQTSSAAAASSAARRS